MAYFNQNKKFIKSSKTITDSVKLALEKKSDSNEADDKKIKMKFRSSNSITIL